MKNNTKIANTNQTQEIALEQSKVGEDLKHSLLIVSLLANTFVLIGWVALQVTTVYDYQVASFLFTR